MARVGGARRRDVPFAGDVDDKADVIVFAQAQGKVYVSLARRVGRPALRAALRLALGWCRLAA